jgi:hypothetical protein
MSNRAHTSGYHLYRDDKVSCKPLRIQTPVAPGILMSRVVLFRLFASFPTKQRRFPGSDRGCSQVPGHFHNVEVSGLKEAVSKLRELLPWTHDYERLSSYIAPHPPSKCVCSSVLIVDFFEDHFCTAMDSLERDCPLSKRSNRKPKVSRARTGCIERLFLPRRRPSREPPVGDNGRSPRTSLLR